MVWKGEGIHGEPKPSCIFPPTLFNPYPPPCYRIYGGTYTECIYNYMRGMTSL